MYATLPTAPPSAVCKPDKENLKWNFDLFQSAMDDVEQRRAFCKEIREWTDSNAAGFWETFANAKEIQSVFDFWYNPLVSIAKKHFAIPQNRLKKS